MGCGCSKVTSSQAEIIEEIKRERVKGEEEQKKLSAEKLTPPIEGVEARKPEVIAKIIDGYIKYNAGLKEVEDELAKNEYNLLEKLQDLLSVLFTFPVSKLFDEIPKQLDKIRAFFKSNLKPKKVKTQTEIIAEINLLVTKSNDDATKNLVDLTRPENKWLDVYIRLLVVKQK